jgi:hypothetical protein
VLAVPTTVEPSAETAFGRVEAPPGRNPSVVNDGVASAEGAARVTTAAARRQEERMALLYHAVYQASA